ncbi:MAG: hypothetical protein IT381_12215 [Deltaproteobacteria bacterium]|nr:hypothetical protein [Deltaproteobacteria bacterium]
MADDDWDDALGDRAQQTVSPDVVRKLLEMNPALRERGMTTNVALDQANQAQTQKAIAEAQAKKPASVGVTKPASVGATQKPASKGVEASSDVVSAFKELKTRLANGNKRIDEEMAKLKKAKDELSHQMRAQLVDWLMQNDPDMRSPVTQSVLDQEKAFLQQVGFTVKGYVEERTKKAK